LQQFAALYCRKQVNFVGSQVQSRLAAAAAQKKYMLLQSHFCFLLPGTHGQFLRFPALS